MTKAVFPLPLVLLISDRIKTRILNLIDFQEPLACNDPDNTSKAQGEAVPSALIKVSDRK